MNSSLPHSSIHISPPTWTPWYYSPASSLIPGVSDQIFALLCPVVSYWCLSLFFHLLDNYSERPPFSWMGVERYRMHDSDEMKARNKVTPAQVFRAVVVQQLLQTALGLYWLDAEPISVSVEGHVRAMQRLTPWISSSASILLGDVTAARLLRSFGPTLVYAIYWYMIPALKMLTAFFVIDTWQYFLHRFFHVNQFLYKHFHSVHHRLYVPYAYGALYNHPFEGFVLDSLGAVVSESLAGLSVRQSALLFAFSSAKTVDDHCGYSLPWDPLQFLYKNNARYHDVHHQHYGLKYNFSQPFWIHWDVLLGTRWDKPARPLVGERNAPMAERPTTKDSRREPSYDSELSSDSGIALVKKKE